MEKEFQINEVENNLILRINKNVYSKEIITQTTYVLLEKYYFLIDEEKVNDNEYWSIMIKPKEEKKISENDALIFIDELIESSSYIDQLKRTEDIRQLILEKAILSQTINDEMIESEKNNHEFENN